MSQILHKLKSHPPADPNPQDSSEKEAQALEEGESMVLEEDIDCNYEPTEQEIREYATFLGMDLDADQDLLWIARDGLKEPLPSDWKPCQTKQKEIYYFNFSTGETQWEHPMDNLYKEKYQKEKTAKQERALLGGLRAQEEKDE